MFKKTFYTCVGTITLVFLTCSELCFGQFFSNPHRWNATPNDYCSSAFNCDPCDITFEYDVWSGVGSCDCDNGTLYTPYPSYVGTRRSLFNGSDLTGWTNVKGEAPGSGWKVVDGMIFRESNSGDLYVDGKFENFILEFEFKISEKGNSGVKYRSWNTEGFGLGCEYQIYDDINDAKNPPKYQTASLYDVIVPREGTSKIKMGEFNKGKIIVLGDHIEHYLNDELIVSVDVGSDEWNKAVEKSKFKDVKEFGVTKIGRIFLQDHNCQVWFKELYITELQPADFCY